VVRDPEPAKAFAITPASYERAVTLAVARSDEEVASTWFDSFSARNRQTLDSLDSKEGMFVDRRVRRISAVPDEVFATVERIGGASGWPYANVLWRIRGL